MYTGSKEAEYWGRIKSNSTESLVYNLQVTGNWFHKEFRKSIQGCKSQTENKCF